MTLTPEQIGRGRKCSCMEIAGEDPRCILHGQGSRWAKENPDISQFAEDRADLRAAAQAALTAMESAFADPASLKDKLSAIDAFAEAMGNLRHLLEKDRENG